MRFDGEIKSWNDERGFGFIEPRLGGEHLFVHIKAFRPGSGRPVVGGNYSFEVESGPDGRKRAKAVESIRRTRVAPRGRRSSRETRARPFIGLAVFCGLFGVAIITRHVPAWIAGFYVAMSVLSASAYLVDKSAAEHGRWRVSESTLLLFGLFGGWPGALIARQLLRHKTGKAAFQARFKGSVAVNVLLLIGFAASLERPWLAR